MLSLSASIGHIVAILAILPPWILIYLVSGWDGMIEAWPLAIVGLTVMLAAYLAHAWHFRHYINDDAFITFRYSRFQYFGELFSNDETDAPLVK